MRSRSCDDWKRLIGAWETRLCHNKLDTVDVGEHACDFTREYPFNLLHVSVVTALLCAARKMFQAPAAFRGGVRASVINEHAPDELGGDAEELRTIFPLRAVMINQPQIGFRHDCGGLQGVIAAFARAVRRAFCALSQRSCTLRLFKVPPLLTARPPRSRRSTAERRCAALPLNLEINVST